VIGAASIGLDLKSRSDSASVDRALGVLKKISDLRPLLRRTESAARGFALTGDPDFAREYRESGEAMLPAFDGLIEAALTSKNFKRAFPKARLDRYREELHYPGNDQLCQEAVWISQNMLLTSKQDIDDIANAIAKVYENRDKLA
jgi:hypothetical protein